MTLVQRVDDLAPWIEHLLHRKVPEDLAGLTYSQVAHRVRWVEQRLSQMNEEVDRG